MFLFETSITPRSLTTTMAEDAPSPDEVQQQMKSAIERIRKQVSEPDAKSEDLPWEKRADETSRGDGEK